MNPLEERYRVLLRLLPAGYRQVWEEDMVATFLDGAQAIDEADLPDARPTWSESASVVALAARLRLGAPGATPGAVLLGAGVRLFALVGPLVPAVLATLDIASWWWTSGRIPGVAAPRFDGQPLPGTDLWHLVWDSGVAWTVAYLALVFGHRRAARILAPLAAVPTACRAASYLGMLAHGTLSPLDATLRLSQLALIVGAPVVALLVGFHRDAPPIPRRPWLLALVIGIAGDLALLAVMFLVGWSEPFDEPGVGCVGLVAAAVVVAARSRRPGPAREALPTRALALALLGSSLLGIRLLTLAQYRYVEPVGLRTELMIDGAGQAAAVLVVVGWAAAVTARSPRPATAAWPEPLA